MFNPFDLSNKVILVTGASSGIGRATAIACSQMGAKVYITARNEERLSETYQSLEGKGHVMCIADLSNAEQVNDFVKSLPVLHGVVLSAGVCEIMPLKFATRKKLDTSFEINFFAQVELLRLLQKGKKLNSGNASVVALSSVGGTSRYDLGNGVYGATKAALLSWMKTAAVELGPSNIRVNCICPGSTKTPMTTFAQLSEEQVNNYLNSIPLRRMGEPEEIAYGAVYLLSDAARWVTGTSLIIDGGISL